MRLALRSSARRLSTLATVVEKGAAVSVHLKTDGFAELPITLPIHRRGETALEPRPGAPMIEVIVDGNPVQIESGSSILQARAPPPLLGIPAPALSPSHVQTLPPHGERRTRATCASRNHSWLAHASQPPPPPHRRRVSLWASTCRASASTSGSPSQATVECAWWRSRSRQSQSPRAPTPLCRA
eukprot:scaffold523_cov101-Isochrysis_galbana.AAC.3